jgi:CBS domain-containing protein
MIVDGTIDDLRQHAPFDRMDRKSLAFLVERFKLSYFAKGRKITGPDYGIARTLYIVQRGLVLGERNDGNLAWNDAVEYGTGECFPVAEVVGKEPAGHLFAALEDSFCYEVGADDVETLMSMSEPFGAFCNNSVNALLVQSHAMLQTFHAQQSKRQQPMNAFLRDLVHTEPVSCPPGEKIKSALEAMQRAKVGSIVVTGNDGVPIGIFTERDLLRHTVAISGSGKADRSLHDALPENVAGDGNRVRSRSTDGQARHTACCRGGGGGAFRRCLRTGSVCAAADKHAQHHPLHRDRERGEKP